MSMKKENHVNELVVVLFFETFRKEKLKLFFAVILSRIK